MVDPVFTYVGGIAFLVLIIGPMLYLMYNYGGVEEQEDTLNESVVRGAGPVAAAAESEDDAAEGGADDTTESEEPADEPTEDAEDTEETADGEDAEETADSEDAEETEAAEADEA